MARAHSISGQYPCQSVSRTPVFRHADLPELGEPPRVDRWRLDYVNRPELCGPGYSNRHNLPIAPFAHLVVTHAASSAFEHLGDQHSHLRELVIGEYAFEDAVLHRFAKPPQGLVQARPQLVVLDVVCDYNRRICPESMDRAHCRGSNPKDHPLRSRARNRSTAFLVVFVVPLTQMEARDR